ncbi:hypothetical protein ALC60_13906 [Trachymyrmex zeteki]|uniref:DNA-directed DNA polymerase n=1 Tax=Mycetomoellerius zeteki TaxID=64791 RepID=A0A151WGV8_9HYME|nr:hypothetical protein ALC60_13906 [Trachymyrmex zeteki]
MTGLTSDEWEKFRDAPHCHICERPTSFEKLVSYLDKSKLTITRSEFRNLNTEDFDLLARKGAFPYEYVNSVDKLDETSLPPRESFYSSLTDEVVSEDDYQYATNIWRRFCIKTLGDYSDLYLKTDVLLLADVFENFRDDDVERFDVMSVSSDSVIGYILEVDFAYPQSVHDAYTDFPFCPIRERPGKRNDKLLATLYDKERYVTYYHNLQQCIQHGLYVKKIYRILQFAQSPWLRGYIELNTRFRTLANNEFEKNLYKLMNNTVFGKTMENVRDHVDVRLVTRWDGRYGAEAMIAKPNFHSRSVFSEDLIAVEMRKLEVKLNKPIYVGMCILEISKMRLYEFHYDYVIPLYRDKYKIMYTDTDSLIYLLECENVYENIKRDIARFDTSDYPEGNAYDIPRVNTKIHGLMKDENNGAIMTEFVGLRAKMYAFRVIGRSDTKRIKGVKKNVVAKTITFDDYTRCLNDVMEQLRRQSCIRSTLHEVYTVSELKLALSPYDDKRYVVPDSVATLPWGHYKIPL